MSFSRTLCPCDYDTRCFVRPGLEFFRGLAGANTEELSRGYSRSELALLRDLEHAEPLFQLFTN